MLRVEREEVRDDMKATDFVSGLSRATFEQVGIDFEDFRWHYHHIHNYLYFAIHLSEKHHGRPHDFTGQELYVHNWVDFVQRMCFA